MTADEVGLESKGCPRFKAGSLRLSGYLRTGICGTPMTSLMPIRAISELLMIGGDAKGFHRLKTDGRSNEVKHEETGMYICGSAGIVCEFGHGGQHNV